MRHEDDTQDPWKSKALFLLNVNREAETEVR